MFCMMFVRRHIFKLAADQLFTTRDLLVYGSRAAVDQALCRLVNLGIITRLARGVFVRETVKQYSALEIATVKTQAFGKQLFKHARDWAVDWGIISPRGCGPLFSVSGARSSFRYAGVDIRLEGLSPRQARLGETVTGQVVRTIWYLKKIERDPRLVMCGGRFFTRCELDDLRISLRWMPAWMSSFFCRRALPRWLIFQ